MKRPNLIRILTFLAILLSGSVFLQAGAPPAFAPAPENTPMGQELRERMGEPLNQGRILFNVRGRFEYADQDGLDSSKAYTLRTRAGYETARYNGFSALIEGEHNLVLNSGSYAAYPPPHNAGQTVIPDGRQRTLNQLNVAWSGHDLQARVGRQVFNLDNQRFVGAVGWRQNNQTFDAARFVWNPDTRLTLSYTWVDKVNRIFGSAAPAANLRRFKSDSHLLTGQFSLGGGARLGAYLYDLDLKQAAALSGRTVGIYLDGRQELATESALVYRLEFARQEDTSASGALDFSHSYLHGRLAFSGQGFTVGVGYEELDGDGSHAFQTPLATLHAFNGWSDVFLTTPVDGLRDLYVFGQWNLPEGFVAFWEAHQFSSARNSDRYGHEFGAGLRKAFSPNFSALLKYSYYSGSSASASFAAAAPDRSKLWIQFEFQL
ncbi:MAG: hypothetical protein JJU20_08660 [Opitutales bacterium]|nr:hypothetical protein [Opitutales bacterium]